MIARLRENPWATVMVVCLGFFMIMLDTTIVYVATPSMLTGLHASIDEVLWVFNGYLLAYAVLLITAGRLGDVFGPRNLFAVGLVVFTAASAACGLSHDAAQLIAARVVQGVGGALLAPQSLTILTATFPAARRGAALGIWGAVVGLSTVAGPTLGGLIVTYLDWPWIFFLNVPVGIVALTLTLLIVPDLRPGTSHSFDVVGTLLASAGLFLLVFGLIEGQKYSWGTVSGVVTIPAILIAGGIVLVVFLVWEAFQKEPLLPLSLFRNRDFSLMNFTGAAMQYGMQGIFIPITIYTQSILGMTALQSGLTIAPMSLAAGVVAPFAGRFADRVGGKYLLMAGLAIFGLGAGWTVYIAGLDSTSWTFLVPLVVTGMGLGLVFAPMTTVAMMKIQPAEAGAASSVLNTTRQLGSAIGAAVVGAVLQNQLATAMHAQAVTRAAVLPQPYQAGFVAAVDAAAKAGLQVGRGQSGGAQLPAGLPAQVAQTLSQLSHDVFVNAYLVAYKPTVYGAVAVLLVASLSCLLVAGRVRRTKSESSEALAEVAA
jgi:EmrB/QacA subfamily drug resistance transporter